MNRSVSVVMPVHNAAPYLAESLGSILNQSFSDFEFVIRDDGSTDGSGQVLREWAAKDERIRLFEGSQLGPAASSHSVVDAAGAPLIARMDADDIAHPDRLRRQVETLQANDIVLLGTMVDMVDRHGRTVRPYDLSRLFQSGYSAPFPHASIMFRADAYHRSGGYRSGCEHWEDLDFYLRMAKLGRIAVLAEPLLAYRVHASTRLTVPREAVEAAIDRRYRCVELHRSGRDYASLLGSSDRIEDGAKCHPRTFVALGSMLLWSGGTPRMLRRLLTRGDLGWNLQSLLAIVWAAWAGASPASLRWVLAARIRLKNMALRHRIVRGRLYDWHPGPPRDSRRQTRQPAKPPWSRPGQPASDRSAA